MMKKLLNTSMIYFALAIAAGVFYREFTKMSGYAGETMLRFVHAHLFALGMLLFLVLALFCRQEGSLAEDKTFRQFFLLYNISLPFMACMMLARGALQVQGAPHHLVQRLLIKRLSRRQIIVLCCIRCHPRHLHFHFLHSV